MFNWITQGIKKPDTGKRVFVGVSGGVDSSVTAALLKDQGYDVTGVFIRTWQPDWIVCTWRNERRDAMRVCAHLNIPFVELDLEQEYKQGVADYMIAEYQSGRTPNPDVMCNREVKFGGFLKWALAQGADYVATGHYAQSSHGCLKKGKDISKDQSYFLWTLTSEQLARILFPVGHLEKSEVRTLAKKYNLPTALKKDSQGICFIGEINMKEFLSHYIKTKTGVVLDQEGETIGTHDGALFYTLGERHGFTITKKSTQDNPYYVIGKDMNSNTITVSQYPDTVISPTEYELIGCIFREYADNGEYVAQIRYHGLFKKCNLHRKNLETWSVVFDESDYTISPGQSVVFYSDNVCIGGGIVK